MIRDPSETRAALAHLGQNGVAEDGLGEAALLLASLDRPGIALDPYRAHFDSLAEAALTCAAETPAAALRQAISEQFRYDGDRKAYDDPQNANLIRVVDRRLGLPVALGILYIEAARRIGCEAAGLNFPNHFLIRVQTGDRREIIDPFNGGVVLDARALRRLLIEFRGQGAALAPEHYQAVGDLDILLRLQNNIKLRRLRDGELDAALAVIRDMRLLAPSLSGLLREEGMALARKGERRAAIGCLQAFLDEDGIREIERMEVSRVLQVLESQLN